MVGWINLSSAMVSKSRPVHSPSVDTPLAAAYGAPEGLAQPLYRSVAAFAPPGDANSCDVGAFPAPCGQYLQTASRIDKRLTFPKSRSTSPYFTMVDPAILVASCASSSSFIVI